MCVTRVAAKPLTARPMTTRTTAARVLVPPKLVPVPVLGGRGALVPLPVVPVPVAATVLATDVGVFGGLVGVLVTPA